MTRGTLDNGPASVRDSKFVKPQAAPRSVEVSDTDGRIAEFEAALLRARAETENVRKREARESEKNRRFALEGIARDLLPIRDNLERGLAASADPGAEPSPLHEGTELTLRLLEQVFERYGIEAIDPLGQPFDPERHEAMSVAPRGDVAPDTVVGVYERGYALNGRVLRPARVLVSSATDPR